MPPHQDDAPHSMPRRTPWYRRLRAFFWSSYTKGYHGPRSGRFGLEGRKSASWERRTFRMVCKDRSEQEAHRLMYHLHVIHRIIKVEYTEMTFYGEDDE